MTQGNFCLSLTFLFLLNMFEFNFRHGSQYKSYNGFFFFFLMSKQIL
jgi:hypothetical protein